MPRELKTLHGGDRYTVLLTKPDWDLLLEYKVKGILVRGERANWDIGRYFARSAYQLWTAAESAYRETAPKIHAIRNDIDLNHQGKNRRALELLEPVIQNLEHLEGEMNQDIVSLVEQAPKSLSPVQPLADKDLMGFMRDQEIRTFLSNANDKTRRSLHAEMLKGERPSLTAAVLRAESYVITGFSEKEVQRLEKAGIAAAHGEDIEALDQLRLAYDDARTAALRVVRGLAEIIGPLEQGAPLARRFEPSFQKNPNLDALDEWLRSIPRPPKPAEKPIEQKSQQEAA